MKQLKHLLFRTKPPSYYERKIVYRGPKSTSSESWRMVTWPRIWSAIKDHLHHIDERKLEAYQLSFMVLSEANLAIMRKLVENQDQAGLNDVMCSLPCDFDDLHTDIVVAMSIVTASKKYIALVKRHEYRRMEYVLVRECPALDIQNFPGRKLLAPV